MPKKLTTNELDTALRRILDLGLTAFVDLINAAQDRDKRTAAEAQRVAEQWRKVAAELELISHHLPNGGANKSGVNGGGKLVQRVECAPWAGQVAG